MVKIKGLSNFLRSKLFKILVVFDHGGSFKIKVNIYYFSKSRVTFYAWVQLLKVVVFFTITRVFINHDRIFQRSQDTFLDFEIFNFQEYFLLFTITIWWFLRSCSLFRFLITSNFPFFRPTFFSLLIDDTFLRS